MVSKKKPELSLVMYGTLFARPIDQIQENLKNELFEDIRSIDERQAPS